MRSGNPVLGDNTFLDVGSGRVVTGNVQAMSINGTVNKTGLLLVLLAGAAAFSWDKASGAAGPGAALPWLMTGAIGGLVVALITVFKKAWSPVTAPAYALLEGLFIGAFSAMMEARFPGIVLQAVGLTFGTLASLLVAYRSGLIRATEKFKLGVVAATGGIALLYLVDIGMGVFGHPMGFIHNNTCRLQCVFLFITSR